jgi:hypothetical protein
MILQASRCSRYLGLCPCDKAISWLNHTPHATRCVRFVPGVTVGSRNSIWRFDRDGRQFILRTGGARPNNLPQIRDRVRVYQHASSV